MRVDLSIHKEGKVEYLGLSECSSENCIVSQAFLFDGPAETVPANRLTVSHSEATTRVLAISSSSTLVPLFSTQPSQNSSEADGFSQGVSGGDDTIPNS